MPLTCAHPAAAIPLLVPLGRWGVLSALVIGSLTPDLAYMLPWSVSRQTSHSLLGLGWFCLPMGLLTYILFHGVLKGPLLSLVPLGVLGRLRHDTVHTRPAASWWAVLISLGCGALTHLLWDALTHAHAPVVMAFPLLQRHLWTVSHYPVYVYTVLQHGSTCVGLALLSAWTWRWAQQAPWHVHTLPVVLTPGQRLTVTLAMTGIASVVGLRAGLSTQGTLRGLAALRACTGQAIFAGLPVLGMAIFVYSLGWQVWRLWRQTAEVRRPRQCGAHPPPP